MLYCACHSVVAFTRRLAFKLNKINLNFFVWLNVEINLFFFSVWSVVRLELNNFLFAGCFSIHFHVHYIDFFSFCLFPFSCVKCVDFLMYFSVRLQKKSIFDFFSALNIGKCQELFNKKPILSLCSVGITEMEKNIDEFSIM